MEPAAQASIVDAQSAKPAVATSAAKEFPPAPDPPAAAPAPVEEEKVRQREERLKLDRAYRIEKERFEAEWAERARLVLRERNDRVDELELVDAA